MSKHARQLLDLNRSRVTAMAGTQPRFQIQLVTPALAAEWLEKNTANQRPVGATTVKMYARDMAAGLWQLTPQGISFNRTGELVDGQHRLHAVILAGVPIEMVVATGFVVEYDSPLDQGRVRSIGQVLHQDHRWVSVVRALMLLESGNIGQKDRSSLAEVQAVFARHREALEPFWPSGRKFPGGVTAALVWAYPLDRDAVLNFATQVRTGELLERGDPAFALRNWHAINSKARPAEFTYATCNALRATLQGERLGSIYTGATGYRWLCQRRRGEGVPHTPICAVVPTLGGK
jgi:hypothetical protein